MPVNQLNLPAIFQAAESVKGLRNQNAMADMTLQKDRRFNALAPDIAGGDYGAYQKGLTVDPKQAQSLWGAYTDEENGRREQVARLVGGVLQQPPEARPSAWKKARQMAAGIPGLDLSQVPEEYDEQTAQMILSRATDPKAMQPLSNVAKIRADFEAGRIDKATYDAAIAKATKLSGGTSLSVGKDGTIEFRQGGYDVTPGGMAKPTQNKVEDQARNTSEGLARLDQIKTSFRPEFLQIGTRLDAAFTAGKEKLNMQVSDQDRQLLSDFTTFKRNTVENLNLYIREITGAQMSEPEAKRLMAGMPVAGQGVFDGDSPTEFQSKMNSVINSLELANARAIYAARNGVNAFDVELSKMKAIVNQRYAALVSEYELLQIPHEEAKKKAQAKIKEEFGI